MHASFLPHRPSRLLAPSVSLARNRIVDGAAEPARDVLEGVDRRVPGRVALAAAAGQALHERRLVRVAKEGNRVARGHLLALAARVAEHLCSHRSESRLAERSREEPRGRDALPITGGVANPNATTSMPTCRGHVHDRSETCPNPNATTSMPMSSRSSTASRQAVPAPSEWPTGHVSERSWTCP